jgi:rhamnogalacturonyl hydrolase YesR
MRLPLRPLVVALALAAAFAPARAQVAHLPAAQQLGEGSRQPGDAPLPVPNATPRPRASSDGRPWAVRVAESVMRRNPQTHRRWDYTGGVVLGAIERVGLARRDPRMLAYVKENPDGTVSLTNVVQVSGLGGNPRRDGSYRDGSYAYYVSEPVVTDDYKGVGPFILAALELGR